MNILKTRMMQAANPSLVEGLSRFFKTGKGQYGEGDLFLGIKVPVTRSIVKECWKNVSFIDLEECISSEYHEIRLAALLCLARIFRSSKRNSSSQKECIEFYLSNTEHINNWDLVDLSCYELLGAWLMDKDRTLLYDLARNGKTIWEQRIGIVSTLLQKAAGWMLREAGKRDEARLVMYLRQRWNGIPATMRRYACEKLSPETVESLRRESITIRKTKQEDIPRLMEIFAKARRFMASTGNPEQWAEDYPGRELLLKDISRSDSFVVQAGKEVIATFVLRAGEDPTYSVIYDGEWPDAGPYATIHRIASDGSRKGIFNLVMKFALDNYDAIRIDTHRDNRVMRNAILREGFRYCGIIRCWNGTERLAYQFGVSSRQEGKISECTF